MFRVVAIRGIKMVLNKSSNGGMGCPLCRYVAGSAQEAGQLGKVLLAGLGGRASAQLGGDLSPSEAAGEPHRGCPVQAEGMCVPAQLRVPACVRGGGGGPPVWSGSGSSQIQRHHRTSRSEPHRRQGALRAGVGSPVLWTEGG